MSGAVKSSPQDLAQAIVKLTALHDGESGVSESSHLAGGPCRPFARFYSSESRVASFRFDAGR